MESVAVLPWQQFLSESAELNRLVAPAVQLLSLPQGGVSPQTELMKREELLKCFYKSDITSPSRCANTTGCSHGDGVM